MKGSLAAANPKVAKLPGAIFDFVKLVMTSRRHLCASPDSIADRASAGVRPKTELVAKTIAAQGGDRRHRQIG